jgi:N-acetylglucosaminyl-diphospho-decaprenol L-rhamnosyltransferase
VGDKSAYDVVISVVCTNNRAALEGCLEALSAACDGLRWQATVVDNAGTDGTSEMVRERFPWATLIRNERPRGFSDNHNLTILPALEREEARYVLVLNDDTVFDPGALATMVAEMDAAPDIGALGPRIRGLDGEPQQSLFEFPTTGRFIARQFQIAGPGAEPDNGDGWLNGSCLLLRASALAEVGSLDPEYFIFYEDTDLGLRLRQGGYRSALSAKAGMVHLEHQTVSTPALSSVMARQMLRSQWLYALRHHGRGRALLVSTGTRAALLLRWLKAKLGALLGDLEERDQAKRLLRLARYRPSQPLPHENPSHSG